jgi:hypothetical protein
MDDDDAFYGKTTSLNCFYRHMIFEQKVPKPAIVIQETRRKDQKYRQNKRLYKIIYIPANRALLNFVNTALAQKVTIPTTINGQTSPNSGHF